MMQHKKEVKPPDFESGGFDVKKLILNCAF